MSIKPTAGSLACRGRQEKSLADAWETPMLHIWAIVIKCWANTRTAATLFIAVNKREHH